jgi:3-mercaptopyruvate sulfurtransferase SseA
MRFLISVAAVAILALMGLAGCNSMDKGGANNSAATVHPTNTTTPQPPATASNDGARRVTTVELNDALSKGEAIVVDVRGDAAYKQAHIKGAIMIPSNEVANHLSELPHDKLIVTYCS